MTSLQTSIKQNASDSGYFIPLGDMVGRVVGYNATANTFSTASWAFYGSGAPLSSIRSAGAGILKDMGKTVVSSLRTFRKVQLVVPGSGNNSTFGVGGRVQTTTEDYFTGYIELGFDGYGTAAPVAPFGR